MEAIDLLLKRRSVKAKELVAPAPNEEELQQILTSAMRVPDHGKLAPWKFLVLREEGQKKLGTLCADIFMRENDEATEKHHAFEVARMQRAPLLIVVMHIPLRGKIPLWEQELSTGAVCMNLLHATHALGYAGQWLSEWPCYHDEVKAALGGGEEDRIAGFFYIGSADEVPEDRKRPDYDDVVSEWTGA